MRRWLPLLLAAVALPARTDFKIVSRTTVDGSANVTTQYRQGQSFRWENRRVNRNIGTIFHGGSYYLLDLTAKKYVESSRIDPVLTLATWLRRPPRVRDSGKTVNVYFETVDTGERRQMFGYTARHLITRERQVAEQGACSGNSETEKDGWYIPYAALGPRAFLDSYAGFTCTDRIVAHGAKEETGFSVQETTTTTYSPAGFPSQALSMTIQVIEFSEAPLDKSLFSPPPDFQRVDSLPGDSAMTWFERVEFVWGEFEQAVASWFE